jgi:hypothetical protein
LSVFTLVQHVSATLGHHQVLLFDSHFIKGLCYPGSSSERLTTRKENPLWNPESISVWISSHFPFNQWSSTMLVITLPSSPPPFLSPVVNCKEDIPSEICDVYITESFICHLWKSYDYILVLKALNNCDLD